MSFSNSDYQIVLKHLKSLSLHFSENWVIETINHYKSSNPNAAPLELNNAVFQQWLMMNLRDLKVSSLPTNLKSENKIILNGTYAVQVESMLDISKSCYSELQRIKNISNENIEITEKSVEDFKSKRCLLFVLSDGVQEIQAMEYQLISCIKLDNSNFLPGFKMLIKGPVICRKGMLLLKEENIKIYGGKVETLCKTNNLESLLVKNLDLVDKITENNFFNENKSVNSNKIINCVIPNSQLNTGIHSNNTSSSPQSNINSSNNYIKANELLSENNDELLKLSFEADALEGIGSFSDELLSEIQLCSTLENGNVIVESNPKQNGNEKNVLNYKQMSNKTYRNASDEDILSCAAIKKAKIEEEIVCLKDSSAFNNFESDINFMAESFNIFDSNKEIVKSKCNSELDTLKKGNMDENTSFLTNLRSKNCESLSQASLKMMKGYSRLSTSINPYPFVYLRQIIEMHLLEPSNFIIKAIILTLKSKISLNNDEFALKASISDGSFTIDVNFSSDILENVLEYSPCEITSMMNEKDRNLAIYERLKNIFFVAQQKLLSMNCLMEIKFFNERSIPYVVSLEEIQLKHLNALKERMI